METSSPAPAISSPAQAESSLPPRDEEEELWRESSLLAHCRKLLDEIQLGKLAEKITLRWNPRMRSTAGRAFWPEAKIELNPKLRGINDKEVMRTMLHELAHLVAYYRAGRKRIAAHGAEWQQACIDLGIPGERATHSLPLPSNKQKRKWRYTCPACGEGFDRVRRMKRYAGCYACCKKHNGGYYHKDYRLVEAALVE
ncbi:MAG: SprT-like domain-containing protein [Akkermansiaceae bacterium]